MASRKIRAIGFQPGDTDGSAGGWPLIEALYIEKYPVLLIEPNSSSIKIMLKRHDEDGDSSINESLTKLFVSLEDETNEHEVSIKAAALNQIYSTKIQYIAPVVSQICKNIDDNHKASSLDQYVETVDKIATVTWVRVVSRSFGI